MLNSYFFFLLPHKKDVKKNRCIEVMLEDTTSIQLKIMIINKNNKIEPHNLKKNILQVKKVKNNYSDLNFLLRRISFKIIFLNTTFLFS